jgi:outer membrane protein OmpA-like peptidoglycan-associated protein
LLDIKGGDYMPDQERLSPKIPDNSASQAEQNLTNALRTTLGDYYFAGDSKTIRPEILEKMDQISKGRY